ncbi:MAG: phosphate signaling complex protein PhoU, partial [Thermoleophilia bacterium]|nr:phosphate signaling complex protein PhoU [Thermoleophilia bacterium]
MRDNFQNDLDWLVQRTEESLTLVRGAVEKTVAAILERDAELANQIIAGDDQIDAIYQTIHSEMLGVIARQAPVASDLRLLTGLGYMAIHIERMGDGCVNIAKLIKLAGPHVYPTDLTARIAAMGKDLITMIDQAGRAFRERNVDLALDLVRLDDAVDDGNRRVFQIAVGPELPPEIRQWAGYMLLIGRAMERIGDHAVDLGEQIAFIVTGEFREFTDASHEDSLEWTPDDGSR